MATVSVSVVRTPIHPLHAIFLAFPLPLFFGGWLSDLAYRASFQIQWINFAAWLIAGALLVGAFAVVWAIVDVARASTRDARAGAYLLVLLAMWVLGLVNAFVHGKDAWATMPEGLYLSAITTLLAFAAAWLGYSRGLIREAR